MKYQIHSNIVHARAHTHTCLGSGCCSAPQWAIQKLMCAGGTGPRHQPGRSFMEKQLERDGVQRERGERRGGGGGTTASDDDSHITLGSTSERLWSLVNNAAKRLPQGVCVCMCARACVCCNTSQPHRELYIPCTACKYVHWIIFVSISNVLLCAFIKWRNSILFNSLIHDTYAADLCFTLSLKSILRFILTCFGLDSMLHSDPVSLYATTEIVFSWDKLQIYEGPDLLGPHIRPSTELS